MRRRVAVTGIGAVTPIGLGARGLWQGVLADRSAVREIDRFDASPFPSRIAAQIDGFRAEDHLDARRARRLDRFSQLAVAASRMAADQAGWGRVSDPARTGVWIGSALGGVAFGEEQHAAYVAGGVRKVSPTLATAVFGGAGAANVAIDMGIRGPAVGNANSCASGAMAIGQAFHAVRDGVVDAALAGGAEAPLAPLTFGAFAMIRVLSTRNADPATASRPFDAQRDGFVMGEGAAVLALEAWDAAVDRGAEVIGEVVGFGASADAHHLTAPLPSGEAAAAAVTTSLQDAQLAPTDIGYVNAHASSTDRPGVGDEGPVRACPWRVGRDRGGDHGHGPLQRPAAGHLQPPHRRSRDRPGRPARGPPGASRRGALDLLRLRRAERRARLPRDLVLRSLRTPLVAALEVAGDAGHQLLDASGVQALGALQEPGSGIATQHGRSPAAMRDQQLVAAPLPGEGLVVESVGHARKSAPAGRGSIGPCRS